MQAWKVVVGTARGLGAWGALGILGACAPAPSGIPPELLVLHAHAGTATGCSPDEASQLALGLDTNGNGWLDPEEPSLQQVPCGLPLQIRLAEAPGQEGCPAGGVWVHWGAPRQGQLWCHGGGSRVQAAWDGGSRQPAWIASSRSGPGVRPAQTMGAVRLAVIDADRQGLCPVTGRLIRSGLDTNRNGQLDGDETQLVQHLCGPEEPAPHGTEGDASAHTAGIAGKEPRWQLPQSAPTGQRVQVQGPTGLAWRLAQGTGQRIATQAWTPEETADSTHGWTAARVPALKTTPVTHGAGTRWTAAQSGNGQRLWLAGADGLWHSNDGGAHWQRRGPDASLAWQGVSASADGQRLLASAQADGLYGSDDGGQHWTRRSIGLGYSQLASDAAGLRTLAVRHQTQLWLSTDGGHGWQPVAQASGPWRAIAVSGQGRHLGAVAEGGALRLSIDGGRTWRPVPEVSNSGALAIAHNGQVWAAAAQHARDGVMVSTDGGQQWRRVAGPSRHAAITGLAVGAGGDRWVAVTADGASWISHNQGQDWTREALAAPVHQVAITAEGLHQLAVAADGTLYRRGAATTPGQEGGLRHLAALATGASASHPAGRLNSRPVASLSLQHVGTGIWAVRQADGQWHAQ